MSGVHYCDDCGAANPTSAPSCWNCHVSFAQAGLLNGRYKIIKQLGKGGFGSIHLAEDVRMNGKLVAIKEVADKSDISQEIQFLSLLDHPNIPPVTDTFEQNGKFYLVMKYIEADDLEKIVARGALSFDEALEIGITICDILFYLHQQQPPIIFRDLKPGNILRDARGKLYLIDFGIARNYTAGKKKDTVAIGSPGYAPPEQYNKSQTDARSDIYSLASTLYHLFTGDDPQDHPFVFNHTLLEQVQKRNWNPFWTMLEMDMNKRPKSMQEAKTILENLKQGANASSLITLYKPRQTTPDGKHLLLLYAKKNRWSKGNTPDEKIADLLKTYIDPVLQRYVDALGRRQVAFWENSDEMLGGSRIMQWWEDAIKNSFAICYICSPAWIGGTQTVNNDRETLFDFFEDTILPTARYLKIPVVALMGRKINDPDVLHSLPLLPANGTLYDSKDESAYEEVARGVEALAQAVFGY